MCELNFFITSRSSGRASRTPSDGPKLTVLILAGGCCGELAVEAAVGDEQWLNAGTGETGGTGVEVTDSRSNVCCESSLLVVGL